MEIETDKSIFQEEFKTKMKIGLLTFHAAMNVGAQLQALALFKTLKDAGHEVEFIRYEPNYLKYPYRFFRNARIKNGIASYVKQCLLHIFCDTYTWIKTKRHYGDFQERFYTLSRQVYKNPDELAKADYDAIITGSDQVWNPEITNGSLDPMYTLHFQSDRIRKISYAAIFSEKHIDRNMAEELVGRIKSFYAVSVREECLKKYLDNLCSLRIEVVLDPTLLLTKSQWLALMPEKRMIKERYVLLYQARGIKKDVLKQATDLADKLHATVYDASGMNYRVAKYGKQYVSPIEFLNLVFFAEAVVTVSFHGTALSLVLEKPFFSICLNDGRDGRVINLLKGMGLSSQLKPVGEELAVPRMDYSLARRHLDTARTASLSFLFKALN